MLANWWRWTITITFFGAESLIIIENSTVKAFDKLPVKFNNVSPLIQIGHFENCVDTEQSLNFSPVIILLYFLLKVPR